MIYSTADEMMAMNPVYGVYRYGTTSQPHSPPHRPVHSGRKGSKKVRTGCITCKIRKVKCDESKPYCLRCTKTGRKCDGYLDPKTIASRRRSRDHDGSPHSSLSALWEWASPEEKRSFHFFQHVTAPSLAGDIDAVFWKVLVLQICQTEPAVRHAVLAVSSLYEGLIQGVVAPYIEGSAKQSFALQQYNKAIACLLDRMHDPTTKPLGPLLTCILFVCIEFMQSKDKESLIHLEQGRQILSQLEQRASSGSPDSEMDVIKQHLVPMYTRLSITSFLFGGTPVPIPQSLKTGKDIPVVFQSLHELRSTLFEFVDAVLRFSQRSRPAKYDSIRSRSRDTASKADDGPAPISPEELKAFEDEQNQLMKQLAKLNVAFSLFKTTKPKEAAETTACVAQMYLNVSKIWISTALTANEAAYDDHLPAFSAIVPLASTILEADAAVSQQFAVRGNAAVTAATTLIPGHSTTPPPQHSNNGGFGFGIETHVIPALFYVATKCRHPFVRHAALNLLKNNPSKRENLWRADMIGAIADHVVRAEESMLLDQKPKQSPDLSRSNLQVPGSHSKNSTAQSTYGRTPEDVWSNGMHGFPLPDEFKTAMAQERSEPDVNMDPIMALFGPQPQQSQSSPQLHSQQISPLLPHSQPPQSHSYPARQEHTPTKPSILVQNEPKFDLDLDMDLDLDSVPIDPALLLDPDVASMHSYSSGAPPSYDASTISVAGPYLNSGKPAFSHARSTDSRNNSTSTSGQLRHPSMSPTAAAAHSPPLSMAESGSSIASGSEYGSARRVAPVPMLVLNGSQAPKEMPRQSTEAPFDLPENLRIHDAIIGPETEEGSWVTVFRKLHGLEEDWDVQTEYVGAW